MEWPSKNIPKGGIFNNARVKYTPETREFVQTLINESKMSIEQRNKLVYSLRRGEPLPEITYPVGKSKRPQIFEARVRPGSSKRRSLQTIRESGAFEREVYRPTPVKYNSEKAKEELIKKMSGEVSNEPTHNKRRIVKIEAPKQEINRFEELKNEIKEREDWLKEMEKLGEGAKYRGLMRLQILERIKEMESLRVME